LPPESAVADREPARQESSTTGVIVFAPAPDGRDASFGHAPHPWGRGTRFPGEWEPRAAKKVATPDRVWPASYDDPGGSVERRPEPPTWFKVSFGTAALLGAMLLAMWATQHGPVTCALSFEAPRRLHLNREVDREHLAADRASVARAARRYTSGTSGDEQERRFAECEDLLVSETAASHGVSVDQVRAATGYTQ
jgi:hypothetical protein